MRWIEERLAGDVGLLFSARFIRLAAYGAISLVLVLHLAQTGLPEQRIGLLLTMTLLGDTVISLAMALWADSAGRKRMLIGGAGLMILGGIAFAISNNFLVLLVAATFGVISPSGNEVGPFLAIEQAALAERVPALKRTWYFSWYQLTGAFATAAGVLGCGFAVQSFSSHSASGVSNYRPVFYAYAALGLFLGILFIWLSPAAEAPEAPASVGQPRLRRFGLHRSHGIVLTLSALFGLDAFGGGFILQSFIAYWFHVRFGALHFPLEYPLAHYEMSFLLPHFLKEGRGKLDVYFTRVFNPVWTYPDGFSWIEALSDESKIGLHVALTPTWNETAYWADLVLPMGHGPERHDLNSYETQSGSWIAFRQPVQRVARERAGSPVKFTYEANPGAVWEEDEFWIELSWQIDPTGELGIRRHFESPYRPGEPISVAEYYRYIFERVPGLPAAAAEKGVDTLEYMRRFGAFQVLDSTYGRHETPVANSDLDGAKTDAAGVVRKGDKILGVRQGEKCVEGFATPSRKQELYSGTLGEWGWPEYELPGYIPSHLDWRSLDADKGEFCLLPTFRLPTLIHSRTGAAKWLNEISQCNPLWVHPSDGKRLGLMDADLARVETEIGYFIDRVWLTEAIRPGVVACSHHLGRWRRAQDAPGNRFSGNIVEIAEVGRGQWRVRQVEGPGPFVSSDPDSSRVWWREGGVPQNLIFPVQPDPISGMHCWHQRVTVRKAAAGERYGDVFVDTTKAHEVYRRWLAMTRAAPGPGGLRRPLWMNRPLRPTTQAFYCAQEQERPAGQGGA